MALVKALAMNLLDISIIVIMIFFIVRGLFRGFFMEIASLAGVILGILLGLRLHPLMTGVLRPYLPSIDNFFLQLISFAIIFAVVLILCNLTGLGLKIILKKTSLGWTDKGLGAGLAVLKGIIITYIAIVILTFFVPSTAPLVARSKLAPWIISSYQSIVSLISPEFYQSWKRRFIGQKKKIDEVVSKKIEELTGENGS
ncbi:MAG: CvpA family protein [Deltaproteobacteria bacterium]|nr:CvpA family protein [Deltaproteobacteria bacterium]